MACVKRRQSATEAYQMTGYTGTVIYMAPEVVLRQPYSEKVVVYSFGMILWQMTSGVAPYAGMYQEDFMTTIVRGGSRPKIRDDLPPMLFKLIERCWDCDPIARPSCAEILDILAAIKDAAVRKEPYSINSFGSNLLKILLGGSGGSKVADESSAMSMPDRK